MTQDARFEDGGDRPLNLGAEDAEDLKVISALVQDSVLPVSEMRWQRGKRRLALLLNRLRWEDVPVAQKRGRPVERVQSLLVIGEVMAVASQGLDRREGDTVLSILSMSFEPGEDGTGHILLTLAGDGAIRASVEAIDVSLRDVTRPYVAPSRRVPDHS
ncbi:MAG: DUF2948 family protein [Roseivivax sp.]|nr:DUF2948 family protein [Roseivivax sp.]